jgi:CheY-like chemotaxis protein
MPTQAFVESLSLAGKPAAGAGTQIVVIVSGNTEVIDLLGSVVDAGRYDVVFVESSARAYSQIKRVRPHLVILCVRIDDGFGDRESLQVLTMLKLDADTRGIPVLTYASGRDREAFEGDSSEPSGGEMFAPRSAVRMN